MPAVYTNVAYFADWIEEIVWGDSWSNIICVHNHLHVSSIIERKAHGQFIV